ncbi:urea carboxylase [Rhodococcoides kroppenstedtii]|uniref:urea carboxylase n=1 Tax=Rhodococcoides kroppenstedtii TaxID=293050 RepID=UPI0028E39442|nr:urea carboxylase [Rhodococcus kroppenstedtii]
MTELLGRTLAGPSTDAAIAAAASLSFDTLLVANRGEIACRIVRGARELGLRTVAVYSDADRDARHVRMADEAVRLGEAPAAQSYLRADAVVDAALATGAGAVHPGYGFLSENVDFATAVEAAGLHFVGPAPDHLRVFGDKHTARRAAAEAGVPLVAGSGLLSGSDDAVAAAAAIGFPVILKAVGGGGGIGMQACRTPGELVAAYDRVIRLAENNFGSSGVFLERFVERARHLEVQVFGDGEGRVVSLGTRDCSLQRRNQKVIEEAPAPALPEFVADQVLASARALTAAQRYRSAGTVEFVYDVDREEASFLEVNTRLQVEHPVTEAVTGVDLVGWMLRLAGGDRSMLTDVPDSGPAITGHAVEARVYAEDPGRDYRPSAGLLTDVAFPDDARIDTHVETGSTVSSYYDPMLAKVIVHRHDRTDALHALHDALTRSRLHGVSTNLGQLRIAAVAEPVVQAVHTTGTLADLPTDGPRIDVERAGVSTTVQDVRGRTGLWNVGIPPSGAYDDLSLTLANRLVGNDDLPALECTLTGPRLRFSHPTVVAVTGADAPVTLDGEPVPMWEAVTVPAGGVLDLGAPADTGLRTYLAVRGGLDAPDYHGSAATFTLGGFGGVTGRALVTGDVLRPAGTDVGVTDPAPVDPADRPEFTHHWHLAVGEGPHPAPDYFTRADLDLFYESVWTVSAHANRTGIRLEGPKPEFARTDGGDAGLHPSNLHDCPYSVGALNVSGDTPILLGPDGPSLGGFACPLTVVTAHRWKLGQIRPGDTVRFVPVSDAGADALRTDAVRGQDRPAPALLGGRESDDGVLGRRDAGDGRPEVRYLRGGDDNVLVEYGPRELDLGLRIRVHALASALAERAPAGLIDATPGVRSLHLHVDPDRLPIRTVVGLLAEIEEDLPPTEDIVVPSRRITLPLSFDDPSILEAIDRYRGGVRPTAPWLPSNTEFVRRINGLDSVDDVRRIVFDAEYLVLGLGDVYLGAPLAVPLDPRHRLVTTKYNPARTWTPSDAVGIGGKYLCVYGMESPGGYQLIGRTVPIWSGHSQRAPFEPGVPWLFRWFDRISWTPVTPDELIEARDDARAGRFDPAIEHGEFSLAEHRGFLAEHADSIADFDRRQRAAFDREKQTWRESGEFDARQTDASPTTDPATAPGALDLEVPEGGTVVEAPMVASVWRVDVSVGDVLAAGDTAVVLEAMKLELPVTVPDAVRVVAVTVAPGDRVEPGSPLLITVPVDNAETTPGTIPTTEGNTLA